MHKRKKLFRGIAIALSILLVAGSVFGYSLRMTVNSSKEMVSISVAPNVVYASPGWESPTSDTANGWTDSGNAWDDIDGTYALYDVAAVSWSPYLELHHAALNCDKVQVLIGLEKDGVNIDSMELNVYYDGSYNNIYTGVVTIDTWTEYSIPAGEKSVTAMQARFYNNHGAQPREVYFYEADFWEVSVEPSITVSPVEYDFGVVAESTTPYTATNYFFIDNTSGIQTDQTIAVTTTTWTGGVAWTHSDTATPGADQAGLLANKEGTWGSGDVIVKYNSPNYIAENQPASTDYSFGLKLIAPTSFGDGVEKQIITRVTAAAG